MKKIKRFLFLFLMSVGFVARSQEECMYLYQVDPLEKILKDRSYLRDQVDTVRVARGETASIQIVVKAVRTVAGLTARVEPLVTAGGVLQGKTGWIGYVTAGRSHIEPSKDLIHSPSGYFPDPILTDTVIRLEAGEVQPMWITVSVPVNAPPGVYIGTVKIIGVAGREKHTLTKQFYVRVYPVTISKTSLWITNWMNLSPENLAYLNAGKPVERSSPLYRDLLQAHAAIVGSHGQNMRLFDILSLTRYSLKDGRYSFDFSDFDTEAEIFERAGALERIEGGHLAYRYGSENFHEASFYPVVPLPDNEETRSLPPTPNYTKQSNGFRLVLLPLTDTRAKNFLNQFLPGLKMHLEKRNWLHKYVQHIADEPVPQNTASYLGISSYVKKHLPGVKIIDAVLTSKQLAGALDIWVPQLDVLDRDHSFYQQQQASGNEVWFYTCIMPQGNYANRFIELPLIQTRYLHWINFKYRISGYLHWGLNLWSGFDDPFTEVSRNRGRLPAGDSYIIYPGYRKLYSSIRFEAMRDGIHDYELLKMAEKKSPAQAAKYANEIILGFRNYDGSIPYFRKIRKQLLEFLSQ